MNRIELIKMGVKLNRIYLCFQCVNCDRTWGTYAKSLEELETLSPSLYTCRSCAEKEKKNSIKRDA